MKPQLRHLATGQIATDENQPLFHKDGLIDLVTIHDDSVTELRSILLPLLPHIYPFSCYPPHPSLDLNKHQTKNAPATAATAAFAPASTLKRLMNNRNSKNSGLVMSSHVNVFQETTCSAGSA